MHSCAPTSSGLAPHTTQYQHSSCPILLPRLMIRKELLAEYASLPADVRAQYEQDASIEHKLGKRSIGAAAPLKRDKSALWGLADDDLPINMSRLQDYLRDMHGGDESAIPGFTKLAADFRIQH